MTTHARRGAAVIGFVGLALMLGDLGYIAHQWHGLDSELHRGFALGLAVFALTWGLAVPLGAREPIGSDRTKARLRARRQKQVVGPITLVGYAIAFVFGVHVAVGAVLGELASLGFVFAISGFREVMHPQHARGVPARSPRRAA
jgi:hypothetical protein